MKTYTFTDTYAKQPELWKEIARDTYEWAKKNGCVMDEDGKIQRYFTIQKSTILRRSTKPVWEKHFKIQQQRDIEINEMKSVDAWNMVVDVILLLHIPIVSQEFEGWYFGTEGMEGAYIAGEINDWFGRSKRILRHINIVVESGHLPIIEPYFIGRLKKILNHHVLRVFQEICVQIMLLSSEPYQHSMAEMLLQPGEDDTDSAAD